MSKAMNRKSYAAALGGAHSGLSGRELWAAARTLEKKSMAASASHEAAHAVVGVRLGFTLNTVDIRVRAEQDASGRTFVSSGYTSFFLAGLSERLGVQGALRARAVFAAAGIVAERALGSVDPTVVTDDVNGIRKCAQALGMVDRPDDPTFVAFFADILNEATEHLYADGGKAWARVRVELKKRYELAPKKVIELVGQHGSMV